MITELLKKSIFLAVSAVFTFGICDSLVTLLPGDPIEILAEESGANISREWIKAELHLGKPLLQKITLDLKNALHANWGHSIISTEEIGPILIARTRQSIALAFIVYFWSMLIAIALGPLSAVNEFQGRSRLSALISLWGWLSGSLSTVWVGPLFLVLFSHLLPIADPVGSVPLATLTLIFLISGGALRLVRERVRDSVRNGSVKGALARGFSNPVAAFRSGFLPISGVLFSYFGTHFGALMTGAFVSEVIFGLPGLGSYLVKSILMRDFPAIQGALFFCSALCLIGTFLGDTLHIIVDPRSRVPR